MDKVSSEMCDLHTPTYQFKHLQGSQSIELIDNIQRFPYDMQVGKSNVLWKAEKYLECKKFWLGVSALATSKF